MNPWQDIDTAEKIVKVVLLFDPHWGMVLIGHWYNDNWYADGLKGEQMIIHPTHWMPLPGTPYDYTD